MMGGYFSKIKVANIWRMEAETETGEKIKGGDNLDQVGSGSGNRFRKHSCNFCPRTFISEVDLLLHFREAHYPKDELSSSDESDDDNDEESESDMDSNEEGGNANANELDFVTDYERALLSKPVLGPFSVPEEEGNDDRPLEPEGDGEDNVEDFFAEEGDQAPARGEGKAPRHSRSNSKWVKPKSRMKVTAPEIVAKSKTKSSPSRVKAKKSQAKCEECGYAPGDKRRLAVHVIKWRSTILKKFKCSECNSTYFKRENALISHVRNFHGHVDQETTERKAADTAELLRLRECIEVVPSDNAKYKKLFKCKLCGRLSTVAGNARSHVRIVHWKQRTFKCDRCWRRFGRKRDMKTHQGAVHMEPPQEDQDNSGNLLKR